MPPFICTVGFSLACNELKLQHLQTKLYLNELATAGGRATASHTVALRSLRDLVTKRKQQETSRATMDINYTRDFMEALIQHGQGRKSFFGTVLSSYQKVSAQRYLMLSLPVRGPERFQQVCGCVSGWQDVYGSM